MELGSPGKNYSGIICAIHSKSGADAKVVECHQGSMEWSLSGTGSVWYLLHYAIQGQCWQVLHYVKWLWRFCAALFWMGRVYGVISGLGELTVDPELSTALNSSVSETQLPGAQTKSSSPDTYSWLPKMLVLKVKHPVPMFPLSLKHNSPISHCIEFSKGLYQRLSLWTKLSLRASAHWASVVILKKGPEDRKMQEPLTLSSMIR